jgi:MFS transporter, FSR family, fosmidomycin resistance protein
MATVSTPTQPSIKPSGAQATVMGVLVAISLCHLINDMMQSLLPAIYPGLAKELTLNFSQIGLITLVYQITASILQPIIGLFADKKPVPLALPIGTLFSMAGLLVLSIAHVYPLVLLGAGLLGMGSSIFHPESSRVARMASGARHGFAQSLFQVGGNAGQALGPLAAAVIVVRYGQTSLAFFALLALLSAAILWNVSRWYKSHGIARLRAGRKSTGAAPLPRGAAGKGVAVLLALIFSKYIYLASLTSFYTFYLIEKFHLTVAGAQFQLFLFLAAVAAGTIAGGPLGDRFGRKYVIWFSILGALPFTLLLPHASLFWTPPLAMLIGLILASAFPAIVVFAQELMPDNVGMVSGLFFGFAFGVGGIGAAALGWAADRVGIETVYHWVAFMPMFGLLSVFLPRVEKARGA